MRTRNGILARIFLRRLKGMTPDKRKALWEGYLRAEKDFGPKEALMMQEIDRINEERSSFHPGIRKEKSQKAFKNSVRKHGADEAMVRFYESAGVRDGKYHDARWSWGKSFDSSLEIQEVLYQPINLFKIIEERLRKTGKSNIQVLEIGAGAGSHASGLKEAFKGRIRLTATGLRPQTRWKELKHAENIHWVIAHAGNLSKKILPGSIDVVHSNLGFCHSLNLPKAFSEVHRILKKGGQFIFTSEKPVEIPINFRVIEKPKRSSIFAYHLEKI